MTHRLNVLIPPELSIRLDQAAQQNGVSKSEWVRRVLREALGACVQSELWNPIERLASLQAPTADIEQMLSEIGAGRT